MKRGNYAQRACAEMRIENEKENNIDVNDRNDGR